MAAPTKRRAHVRSDHDRVFGLRLDHPEFDAMAAWYDFDYEGRMRVDLPFWLRCAREGGGPVLELGAGTGRVSAFLAKAGFDVVGVELSSAMIARAEARRARLRAVGHRLRFVEGDMSRLRVRGRFGTILVPFRAFNHLYTIERQLAALQGIRQRLAPGGLVVIDLWNPDLPDLAAKSERVQVSYERFDARSGLRVVQRFRVRADLVEQMGYLDYWWDQYRGSRRVRRDHAPMRWRWFHRFEFEHLLARAGLAVERLYGDYRGTPLGPRSEDLIFVARRSSSRASGETARRRAARASVRPRSRAPGSRAAGSRR